MHAASQEYSQPIVIHWGWRKEKKTYERKKNRFYVQLKLSSSAVPKVVIVGFGGWGVGGAGDLGTEGGEGARVGEVDVGGRGASSAGSTVSTGSGVAVSTVSAVSAPTTSTTLSTTSSASTTLGTAAAGLLGLGVDGVEVDKGLGLALTIAGLVLGLSKEVGLLLLVLVNGLGGLPLLVLAGALIGTADLGGGAKGGLLLSKLGEVLIVGLGLLLLLGGDSGGIGLGGVRVRRVDGILLGKLSTSKLIAQLGIALVGTPSVGSLLLVFPANGVSCCCWVTS